MKEKLYQVLSWLQGKKSIIFSVASLTNNFLAAQGVYTAEVAAYIQGVLTALTGGAVYGTRAFGIEKERALGAYWVKK